MVSTPAIHVITWTTTHLLTTEGWKAELDDPLLTDYPQSDHLSTVGWAQVRESPPAKDPPTKKLTLVITSKNITLWGI